MIFGRFGDLTGEFGLFWQYSVAVGRVLLVRSLLVILGCFGDLARFHCSCGAGLVMFHDLLDLLATT